MILVTGGTGLVGSHLLLELTGKHNRVRALRRPESLPGRVRDVFSYYTDEAGERFSRIDWVEGDIRDYDSLLPALEGIDNVYHAAADVLFRSGSSSAMIHNNVEGTANVVNACMEKGVRKLCYVSSTAALGTAPLGKQVTEDMHWTYNRSRSGYSVSKFRSEMEVWRGIAEGLKAVIVNPSVIIGPGDWTRSSSYLFQAVWRGLRFYTEGVTGYVDIRDVIKSMISLMESDKHSERYTVSSENLSYRDVLGKIAAALGKKGPRIHATRMLSSLAWRADWLICTFTGRSRSITRDAARSGRKKTFFSNEKIKDAAGIRFIPIDQSIKDTAKIFLRTHPS